MGSSDVRGPQQVDNIIATIDYNGAQIDGSTDEVLSLGDLKGKWEAFGWKVLEVNGNKLQEIGNTLKEAKSLSGKGTPILILMTTHILICSIR